MFTEGKKKSRKAVEICFKIALNNKNALFVCVCVSAKFSTTEPDFDAVIIDNFITLQTSKAVGAAGPII